MRTSLTSLIEGYRCTIYFIIICDRFNPYNIYALLYDSSAYDNNFSCPYLGY